MKLDLADADGRDDIAVELVGAEPCAGLADAVFDDASGAEPLKTKFPDEANAPVRLASIDHAAVAMPRCYLLTGDGSLVWDSVDRLPARQDRALAEIDEVRAMPKVEHAEPVALAGTPRAHAYWHWWVDVVPRMWLLPPRLLLALPPLTMSFQRQTLELLGFADRAWSPPEGVHRFPQVSFTTGLVDFHSRYPSPLLADFATWVRGQLGLGQGNRRLKLYVDRPSGRARGVTNGAELSDYLDAEGFVTVDAGRLTVRQQAALFDLAEIVVGPHGGGLTNLLFCRPGTKALELFTTEGAQGCSCYRVLCTHLGLPYGRLAVAAGGRRERRHQDELSVDIDRLDRAIKAIGATDA